MHEEQHHIYVAWTSNNRVISSGELHCCLLPQCAVLRTCRSNIHSSRKNILLTFVCSGCFAHSPNQQHPFRKIFWWKLSVLWFFNFLINLLICLDQPCPTEMRHWANNYVAIFVRAPHWMTYFHFATKRLVVLFQATESFWVLTAMVRNDWYLITPKLGCHRQIYC